MSDPAAERKRFNMVLLQSGTVMQLVALGMTPSSAFLAVGAILRRTEIENGTAGVPLPEIDGLMKGLLA